MKISVGLGNPGMKYAGSRHNTGFAALTQLADRYRISLNKKELKSITGHGTIEGERVVLAMPQTFMNLSGEAIQAACAYYQADPATSLIVMYDDISLDPGRIRVRTKGSAGGHNGMKSIIQMLGTDRFLRIRIGTGHPPDDYLQIDWVLGHFPLSQRAVMEQAFDRACRAAEALLTTPPELVMSEYNRADEAAGAQDAQE